MTPSPASPAYRRIAASLADAFERQHERLAPLSDSDGMQANREDNIMICHDVRCKKAFKGTGDFCPRCTRRKLALARKIGRAQGLRSGAQKHLEKYLTTAEDVKA